MEICEGVSGVNIWIPPKKNGSDYCRIHRQVRNTYGPARDFWCIQCNRQANTWAWQHGSDPMKISSYEAMCYSCHTLYDFKSTTRIKLSQAKKGNTNACGNTHNRGNRNGQAKLTETEVLTIRRMAESGHSRKEIATIFDLHIMSIGQIIRRERWKHV